MPISLSSITQNEQVTQHTLDLFDQNYKHVGNMNIVTRYIQRPIDPLPPRLNEYCMLEITIVRAEFLKDHDLFGKQDPFITFEQGSLLHRTETAEDAGKFADFNQKFILREVINELQEDDDVIFKAYDEDFGGRSDYLG